MKKTIFTLLLSIVFILPLFSQSGDCVEFDGVNRYMTIPNHSDFNITTSESFTVSCWINVPEFKNVSGRFISKRSMYTSDANKSGYEFWGANDASHFYATNTPNASGNHNNSLSVWPTSYTASTNVWIHIAFIVDRVGGKMYQYINGTEVTNTGTKNISPWAVDNSYDVHVGCGIQGGNPSYFFTGKMDNLRFYKKALSATEIQADMTATVTASTDGLVAGYDFENIKGTVAKDITGNHDATLFNFPTEGDIKIVSANVKQDVNFSGRGNDNEEVLKLIIRTNGNNPASISNLKLKMTGTTDINDVENIKIYSTKKSTKFDPRNPTGKGAILLGTTTPTSGEITLNTTDKLYTGTNNIWVTYKLKETAKEGNKIDAEVISITTENETYSFTNGNPAGSREILLGRKLLFSPGDYSSKNYRIPAICTASDGSLVTLTDKRKYNSTDLPEDIDIVCKRSTDGGKTWSEPVTVAQGQGRGKGYGDAVLIKAKSGKLVALYVGGPGLWPSTASNPLRTYMSTSDDNGLTWSGIADITPQIYGSECSDPQRSKWQGLFFGSGQGLCTKSGRLMAVVAARVPGQNGLQNYVVYSDDEGTTWNVSNRAITGGDEAKVIELNNGDILMSSRTKGNRLWAKSTDEGVNWGSKHSWSEIWGNACDADIMRYTSTNDNFDKNRILHTLPNASDRRNVTMWISYDEATTWPVKKTICAGTSAYSSITILNDGTIGVYLEEDGSNPYKMYFLNFSLNWLTDGADTYTTAGTTIVETPTITPVGGKYGDTQTVTITSTTSDAKIYYTTDGTTPNENATLYTSPFEVDRTMTIKAIAVKDGMANSVIVTESYTIGWEVPGQNREVGSDRYVVSATTEGAKQNLNYTASVAPNSHYIFYNDQVITANQGSKFTLNLEALKGQTDGLQWCQAIILVDWNRDFEFSTDERVAIVGDRVADNGNKLLSISQEISVPKNTATDKPTRLRVVYTDGWRPSNYQDLGADPVDKGRMYDFDIKVNSTSGLKNLLLKNVSISPNPVKNIVNIDLPQKENYDINLLNIDGKIIVSKSILAKHYEFDLSNYASNIYLLNVKNSQGKEATMRIIKK